MRVAAYAFKKLLLQLIQSGEDNVHMVRNNAPAVP